MNIHQLVSGGYWGGPSLCDWIQYPIRNALLRKHGSIMVSQIRTSSCIIESASCSVIINTHHSLSLHQQTSDPIVNGFVQGKFDRKPLSLTAKYMNFLQVLPLTISKVINF